MLIRKYSTIMRFLQTIKDAEVGLKVNDRLYGDGVIEEILKTRIRVKFDNKMELVTYDVPHLKICLSKIV